MNWERSERNNYGLFQGNIIEIAWKDSGKPLNAVYSSVMRLILIADVGKIKCK
jgi:hypothetical protein